MFHYLEVHKVDDDFDWLEIKALDAEEARPAVVRLVVSEGHEMLRIFLERYAAKQQRIITPPDSQARMIEEFFEEACMAKVLKKKGAASPDLVELLPTTVLHFKYPERTSFRKSRAVRVHMYLDEAHALLRERRFEEAMQRLEWVHSLDPANDFCFELKIVCLRSWKKLAECVGVFENWIAARPEQIEPRLGLGELWLYLDQNQRAKEMLQSILEIAPNNCLTLLGLAQAKLKLGESPMAELRRGLVHDPDLIKEMVEYHFDFRGKHTRDPLPRSLMDIAKTYQIPLKRVLERAERGVLPMHHPEDGELFRFSEKELDRHYEVLKYLGLELGSKKEREKGNEEPRAYQPDLFELSDTSED